MALRDITTDMALLEILEDYSEAKKSCEGWHKNIEKWRKWYDFDHYAERGEALPGEERYEDPTPTNLVDTAVGIILANDLEWKAMGFTPDVMEGETTGKIEKYIAGVIEINSEREELDIPYEAVFNLVRDGSSVLYSPWDDILAQELAFEAQVPDKEQGAKPIQGFMESPIRTQVIDPLKTFWVMGGPRRWGQVYRIEEMTVYDVEAQYQVRIKQYDHQDERAKRKLKGELIDCWKWAQTEQPKEQDMMAKMLGKPQEMETKWVVQRALVFERQFIWELQDTPYDDLPYSIGFYKSVDKDKPEGWTHSIIRPIESTLEMMENAINRRQRQITLLSSLPLVTRAMAGRVIEIDPALGGHIPLLPDEDISFPKWPGNPPDVDQQIQYFRTRLQQAGFSEQDLTGGAASGYALSQIGDANKIKLEQPVRALNLLWSSWARKMLRLTEKFGAGSLVRVYGSLKGEDFADQIVTDDFSKYLVRAKLKPKYPGDDVRNAAMGTQAKGTLSDWTIMERFWDIDQPDDENKRILRQMAERHPSVIEYQIRKNLMERAKMGDEAAVMTLMAMEQSKGGNPNQAPGPPKPEQKTGTQSATGEATPQAEGREPPGQDINSAMNQMTGATPQLMA